jgi:hypothetical protein
MGTPQRGYRIEVAPWRFEFVRFVGLQWRCSCPDQAMFGGRGYECQHILAVKSLLAHREEVA